MELDGEIYSPRMPLGRARLDVIERDIWNGAHAGVCHAVYSYGSHPNGGGFCREVTQEVAARLGRMSFSARDEIRAPLRAFLEAMGVTYREHREPRRDGPHDHPFEMEAPPEPASRAKRGAARRRSRALTPEELRAQPQLKLPIVGGGAAAPSGKLFVETEPDQGSGVGTVSLKDTRPLAEQKASWDRFRAAVRSWQAPAAGEVGDEAVPGRRSKTG